MKRLNEKFPNAWDTVGSVAPNRLGVFSQCVFPEGSDNLWALTGEETFPISKADVENLDILVHTRYGNRICTDWFENINLKSLPTQSEPVSTDKMYKDRLKIATMVASMCKESWLRTWKALVESEYSPIENTDKYEDYTLEKESTNEKRGKISNLSNGSKEVSMSGKEINGKEGSITTFDDGKETNTDKYTNYSETTKPDHSVRTQVTAFDSSTLVDSGKQIWGTETGQAGDKVTYTGDHSVEKEFEDRTSEIKYGKTAGGQDNDYQETHTYGVKNNNDWTDKPTEKTSFTNFGTVTEYGETVGQTDKPLKEIITSTDDYEHHVHGNIGVTSNQELINQELLLRAKSKWIDLVARDLVNILTIPVY